MPNTTKLLEENAGEMLWDTGLHLEFLNMTLDEQTTKPKNNKWDYIKLRYLYTTKEANSENIISYGMEKNVSKLFIWQRSNIQS